MKASLPIVVTHPMAAPRVAFTRHVKSAPVSSAVLPQVSLESWAVGAGGATVTYNSSETVGG